MIRNYSNEGFTPDLVSSKELYGLRLWGREIVRVVTCYWMQIQYRLKSQVARRYNNEASRLRLPSYIGFDGAMVSIQGCDPCDESSILSRSPLTIWSEQFE